MAAAPPAPREVEEGEVGQFVLILDEIKVIVRPEGVVIEVAGRRVADLTWREWRVFKTFIDNIYAELRAALR